MLIAKSMDVVLDEAPVDRVLPARPARRPFAWYAVLGVSVLAVVSGLLGMLAFVIVALAYLPAHPGSPPSAQQNALNASNAASALNQLTLAAGYLPIAFVLLFFLPRLAGAPLEALGFRRLRARDAMPIVVAFVILEIGSFAYERILVALHQGAHRQVGFEHMRFHGVADVVVTFAVGCVVAPVAEEIVFRVFLLNAFASWMPFGAAAAASAGLFAWAHLDAVVAPEIFFLALMFTALYRYTHSIYASMILHGVNNSIAFLLIGLQPHA